jgi:hypothetical protein
MTASELRDLLVRNLVRANGGGITRWRRIVGHVKVYPRSTHAHCNWDIAPAGTITDVATAERAIDVIRPVHPFVDEG